MKYELRSIARVGAAAALLVMSLGVAATARAEVIYSETFDDLSVPANWTAFNGTNGQAILGIVDDTAGIGAGNALSIDAFTRQATVGKFDTVSFVNVGDKIELSMDVRLTDMVNNSGGFRMGLYYDHEGQQLSTGYRALMATGANVPSTDVQADGGDPDIGFGVNRENPIGFMNHGGGIPTDDNTPHSLKFSLTRTTDGVMLDVFQNGETTLVTAEEPVVHIPGTGAGEPVPLQLTFNQIVITTNGGFIGMVDNVQVTYTEATVGTAGDFNGDGNVDGADFVIWQTNFPNNSGTATLDMGDANGDGSVDGADFVVWQTNFPTTAGSVTPVPEPTTVGLALSAALACFVVRRRMR